MRESVVKRIQKSLYTNVALREAIDSASHKPYSQSKQPNLSKNTLKRLLKMTASHLHFECKVFWGQIKIEV